MPKMAVKINYMSSWQIWKKNCWYNQYCNHHIGSCFKFAGSLDIHNISLNLIRNRTYSIIHFWSGNIRL